MRWAGVALPGAARQASVQYGPSELRADAQRVSCASGEAMSELTPEAAEFYPTPAYCVHRFLEAVHLPDGLWIEPCVGEGAIVHAVNGVRSDMEWEANDIRDVPWLDCYEDRLWHQDAVNSHKLWSPAFYRSVGITNQPFSKALAIVLNMVASCGHVAILQRLNWMASEERAPWLRRNPPGVYVLPNRPSFTGDGHTDGADYAWYLWPPQHSGVVVLDSTPLEVRRRDERAAAAIAYCGPEQLTLEQQS